MCSCLQLHRDFEQLGHERQQCQNFTYSLWASWVFAEIQSTNNVQPHATKSIHNPDELLSEILCLPLEQRCRQRLQFLCLWAEPVLKSAISWIPGKL